MMTKADPLFLIYFTGNYMSAQNHRIWIWNLDSFPIFQCKVLKQFENKSEDKTSFEKITKSKILLSCSVAF